MSSQAINYRDPRITRLQRINNMFNCRVHGTISSIHNRCPHCYRDRMKEYSSIIRGRNILPRPPRNTRINNNPRSHSAPEINTRRIIDRYTNIRLPPIVERQMTQIIPPRSSSQPSSRPSLHINNNTNLRNIIQHPPLPPLPPRTHLRPHLRTNLPNLIRDRRLRGEQNGININNMLRIQSLFTDDDIRNISLTDRHETPVNLHVLSRDTIICQAPSHGNCVVCQENWENGEMVRKLPCQHVFHIMCIDRWFADNNVCPVCRFTMASS